MKPKLRLSFLILAFGFMSFLPQAISQTATLSGKVVDQNDKLSLPGANVYLKSSMSIGDVTDIDGNFLISGVPFGDQVLVISFLSYGTKEITVKVVEGDNEVINIELAPEAILGQEVVVTGQILGQAKAINQQLNMEALANVVAADRIQELPDVNAAEAIARLPGVAINRSGGEGQKVVIRGMQPKFSAINVNGVRLPSNSGTDRSVDLSLISPELLDGIEVFKSPLPDMDAEAVGGTVNLKLRKAPKEFKFLAKGLGGYNDLNNDWRDYKGVVQASKRVFNDKLGFVAQASIERFNRGGDIITNTWRQGATQEDGVTDIFGNQLRFRDQQEIRRRYNTSLGLDYALKKGSLAFFGLFSETTRDRFSIEERYAPAEPAIQYVGREIDNSIQLTSFSLQGEHPIGRVVMDWTAATTQSKGRTPYDFQMLFTDNAQGFDPGLDNDGNPSNYYAAANPTLEQSFLRSNQFNNSDVTERTNTASINFKLPFTKGDKLGGYFKVGGKINQITRDRNRQELAENFYYLGGVFGRNALEAYDGPVVLLPQNAELISILSFMNQNSALDFINQDNQNVGITATLDPGLMRDWYEAQRPILNNDRSALVDEYEVEERIYATYAMMRLDIGEKLTVIPGFRYELSDNEYRSGISSLNGRYGVNGFFRDTTTTQDYGVFLPHLHLKYQALEWLDIRASYSTTLARPDFAWITPRSQINLSGTAITSGNPDLNFAKSVNYDLFVSAYKSKFGLLSFGVFYKEIDDIFYPWRTNLVDQETADMFGWPEFRGFTLNSYINSGRSTLRGFEIDLQTNLRFLPKPFNGFVINVNYARLDSRTEAFFLTSETELISRIPPILRTTFTNEVREVLIPNQAPHVFNMSIGYDLNGFSARVSGAFQGSKSDSYSANKDFDRFTLEFWRWDASIRQRFAKNWSIFLNLNNFSDQQDITFTRNENYISSIQTYGFTATVGAQYQIR
ncbi:MAG: TonB-dependent receptor [Bacteroidota bacterium]